ncbi:TPA: hypothetical protein ACH3X2_012707 [Trebouxia sp. C0005]
MLAVLGPWVQQRQGAFGATGSNVKAVEWCIVSLSRHNVVSVALCTRRDLQGIEYTLDSCQEPHLFVICKQDRQSADAAVPVMFYYILDGSVYQTPTIHGVLSARLSRCMYSVQSAFLRLQKDLDPLTKSVPAPSKLLSLPSLPTQHSKLQMRRVPSNEDMHSTNRIISHVLRKKALAARGRQQQQSSMLSSEPSEFHLPQIRANTPAVSGAPQS